MAGADHRTIGIIDRDSDRSARQSLALIRRPSVRHLHCHTLVGPNAHLASALARHAAAAPTTNDDRRVSLAACCRALLSLCTMPALDDAGSPPPVLSERARGKQRAVSPRSPSLSEAPRPDAHSADTPTSPRKRSRSASSSSGQRKRARSVIDLDASSEGDGEAVDDDVVDAARDGELDDLLDELDPEALHAVLERTTANATSGSRVGSDVGDPIELSDDSDDEPVVVRPPAAPVPAAPAPVAPSSDHASGPQPFASLTCRASACVAPPAAQCTLSDLSRRACPARRHQCVP